MSEPSAIRVEGLHKSFRRGREVVLKGIDAEFPRGKLTYILGPSGTGKSVLIKIVLGLLRPDRGKIFVDGRDISTLKGKALSSHRLRFGVLFQNSALFDDRTVFENVAFPLYEHTALGPSEIEKRVEKTLSLLGMTGDYDKLPSEISG